MDIGLFMLQPNGYCALFYHTVLDVQVQTDHVHVHPKQAGLNWTLDFPNPIPHVLVIIHHLNY